ncbi:MBL fold metallo-hydrolase [Leptospira idonii]|uniref:MBL fold metallo-hydrolase n=1 Tax=Leptospira idonii TaxID=1193500 RepID=A0A4R9LZJ8_9LEPT|nr:MBL fold metallo-hydrolase [Leptospira idonii]TGN19061.1 MBL fold metallo-hydrolase [Leptospira idonii]
MDSIYTIDCHYADFEKVACAYLLVENGRGTFVEVNTTHALPHLLGKLKEVGLKPEDVDYVIVTHVHLDHAGGSSALLRVCPNAILLAHPKTAKHLIHPSRLIESSTSVYGEEMFRKLYGTIDPVQESRIRVMADGESLEWGDRKFIFHYTRGHANHHFCIYESKSNSIFTGDSFGISYPGLELGKRFIFPTTTPTDFHYEEAVRSLDIIVNTGAKTAYLTHFDGLGDLKGQSIYLKQGLDLCKEAIEGAGAVSDPSLLTSYFESKVKDMIQTLADRQGADLTSKDWELLEIDVNLNAQGLLYSYRRNSAA